MDMEVGMGEDGKVKSEKRKEKRSLVPIFIEIA